MKTKTVTVREGEYLGPVDWSYDFSQHYTTNSHPTESMEADLARLHELCDGGEWEATTDGGWPRCGWGRVLQVGMYDGWPFWRPVPSVRIQSWLGAEWAPFSSVTDIRVVDSEATS